MNRYMTAFYLMSASLCCTAHKCLACDELPVAVISVDMENVLSGSGSESEPYVVPYGASVDLDGDDSEDGDESGEEIVWWAWLFMGEWFYGSNQTFEASAIGLYEIALYVQDDEEMWNDGWMDPPGVVTYPEGYVSCWVRVVPSVEISTSAHDLLLYAEGGPDVEFTASVDPSGGTYLWTKDEFGGGGVTLSDTTSSVVTVHPTSPSSNEYGDVILTLTYTCNGASNVDQWVLRILKPTTTSSTGGVVAEQPTAYFWRRYYYHAVEDQFGAAIDVEGIPCDEDVVRIEGKSGWEKTGPGSTAYHSNDGQFSGGIVVRDTLAALKTFGYARYRQTLSAGGWTTSPQYTITIDTYNYNDPLSK